MSKRRRCSKCHSSKSDLSFCDHLVRLRELINSPATGWCVILLATLCRADKDTALRPRAKDELDPVAAAAWLDEVAPWLISQLTDAFGS